MSAYEVSWDHLAALVLTAEQLDVCTPMCPGYGHDVDESSRSAVLRALMHQNGLSVAYRYREVAPPLDDVPEIRGAVPLDTVRDVVSVLNWVRCYEYQSCESPDWTATFAHRFCETLRRALVARLVTLHRVPWDYEGPALTDKMASKYATN
jgi:hypothetical protein